MPCFRLKWHCCWNSPFSYPLSSDLVLLTMLQSDGDLVTVDLALYICEWSFLLRGIYEHFMTVPLQSWSSGAKWSCQVGSLCGAAWWSAAVLHCSWVSLFSSSWGVSSSRHGGTARLLTWLLTNEMSRWEPATILRQDHHGGDPSLHGNFFTSPGWCRSNRQQ